MAMIGYHVTHKDNLESILKQGLVHQIGRHSRLGGESSPAVYFFVSPEACSNALMNWLADLYDHVPEGDLIVLGVDLTGINLDQTCDFELAILHSIDSDRIVSIETEVEFSLNHQQTEESTRDRFL